MRPQDAREGTLPSSWFKSFPQWSRAAGLNGAARQGTPLRLPPEKSRDLQEGAEPLGERREPQDAGQQSMPSPQPIREEVALGSALGSKNNRFGLPTTAIKLVRPGVSQTEGTEVGSFGYAEGTKVTHSGTCATRQRKCGLSAVNRRALSINGAREPAGCQLSGAFLPPRNDRWPLDEHFRRWRLAKGLLTGNGAAHGT